MQAGSTHNDDSELQNPRYLICGCFGDKELLASGCPQSSPTLHTDCNKGRRRGLLLRWLTTQSVRISKQHYTYVYIHIYDLYIHAFICLHISLQVYTYRHTNIRTCMHVCVHAQYVCVDSCRPDYLCTDEGFTFLRGLRLRKTS